MPPSFVIVVIEAPKTSQLALATEPLLPSASIRIPRSGALFPLRPVHQVKSRREGVHDAEEEVHGSSVTSAPRFKLTHYPAPASVQSQLGTVPGRTQAARGRETTTNVDRRRAANHRGRVAVQHRSAGPQFEPDLAGSQGVRGSSPLSSTRSTRRKTDSRYESSSVRSRLITVFAARSRAAASAQLLQRPSSVAEPTRWAMVLLLAEKPRSVTDLRDELVMSQPGVSWHLDVLRGPVWFKRDAAASSACTN
jgi:hypothetical protein